MLLLPCRCLDEEGLQLILLQPQRLPHQAPHPHGSAQGAARSGGPRSGAGALARPARPTPQESCWGLSCLGSLVLHDGAQLDLATELSEQGLGGGD